MNPFGIAAKFRNQFYDRGWLRSEALPLPVISVGNLTTGGTGKTPIVIEIARHFLKKGKMPLVLSRGYRGELERSFGVTPLIERYPEASLTSLSEEYGDEPILIAKNCPGVRVVVGKNRYENAKEALLRLEQIEGVKPDLFILDDGFQHRKIKRDLDLVVISRNQKHQSLIPFGKLREPVSSLERAQGFIISSKLDSRQELDIELPPNKPVFEFEFEVELPPSKENRWVLISAIGDPASFKRLVIGAGGEVVGSYELRDHDYYTDDQINAWMKEAEGKNARLLVTEKDWVKIASMSDFDHPLYYCQLKVKQTPVLPEFYNWLDSQIELN